MKKGKPVRLSWCSSNTLRVALASCCTVIRGSKSGANKILPPKAPENPALEPLYLNTQVPQRNCDVVYCTAESVVSSKIAHPAAWSAALRFSPAAPSPKVLWRMAKHSMCDGRVIPTYISIMSFLAVS